MPNQGLTDDQVAVYRDRMENPHPGGNAGMPPTIFVSVFLATLDRQRQEIAGRLMAIAAEPQPFDTQFAIAALAAELSKTEDDV